jgi:OFA family oxalate/formate antiporter-like MFS transporter
MSVSQSPPVASDTGLSNRWVILLFSIISMVAVANFQYGWTLFVAPLGKHLNAERAAIQVTFTVFVLLETWLVPFEGWLVDKFGPRLLVMIGGVFAALGWVGSGKAETLTALYLSYALAGIGAGIVYGTAVGSALKWFPDHRGLAAGLTAAGFGAGAAFTVVPIANMIDKSGYQSTFVVWGIIQGVVVIVSAFFLKAPPPGWLPKTWRSVPGAELLVKKRQSSGDFTALEMAGTSQFWLMYLMMAMVATGGLMATAQLGPMATDFKVAKTDVHLLGLAMAALPFALSADRLVNGLCRPFWGWVSDHIGRENTMAIAFGLEAIAIFILIKYAANPMMFVIMSAFTFFGWGEIYSLFPALCGDFFGRKHATANYGFLYTAKGTASLFVPIGSALAAGKAFNFRADALLLLGGAVGFFALFLGPAVLRIALAPMVKRVMLILAALMVAGGILLELLPKLLASFSIVLTMPNKGWYGVYSVAILFDVLGALLAFFVLKRMRVPALPERATAVQPRPIEAKAHGTA